MTLVMNQPAVFSVLLKPSSHMWSEIFVLIVSLQTCDLVVLTDANLHEKETDPSFLLRKL